MTLSPPEFEGVLRRMSQCTSYKYKHAFDRVIPDSYQLATLFFLGRIGV